MAVYKTCTIGKRLPNFASSSSSDTDDSDYDTILSSSTSQYSNSSKAKSSTSNQNTVQRLPTRKPDPNVCNRNALLARENRRKKKEYLETLERELDTMKHANKRLNKTLKKHIKMVKKLQHEKQYYKDLFFGKSKTTSGIVDMVTVVNEKPIPSNCYSPKQSSCSPTDSNRSFDDQPPYKCDLDDFKEDNDSNFSSPMYDATSWDTFLGLNDDPISEEAEFFKLSSLPSNIISGEHNYYQCPPPPPDSGVCLHSVEGTVALEDCLTCEKHTNSLPIDLLVVE